MKWRLIYLAIALLLTLVGEVVTVYYGTAVWTAWSGDTLARALLILLAALGATSSASLWVKVGSRLRVASESTRPRRNSVRISAKMRGPRDV
jgi:hypothetical protein